MAVTFMIVSFFAMILLTVPGCVCDRASCYDRADGLGCRTIAGCTPERMFRACGFVRAAGDPSVHLAGV